jgi:catechol 2,3-dioxygenase-like lactoylglutathione lyase family enzyme
VDFKLELVVLPVSDVDRAKLFYAEKLGFTVDVDHRAGDAFRVVQLTPPGSACSFTIGTGVSQVAPGTYQGCTSSLPMSWRREPGSSNVASTSASPSTLDQKDRRPV